MNKISFILLTIFLGLQNLSAQIPDFYREDLTFILDDSSFTVTGYYYFYNAGEKNKKLDMLYPFPEGSTYGIITDVYAYVDGNPLKDVLLHHNGRAAMIKLEIKADGKTKIRIGYTQELKGKKAEYILTSTQAWGQPLKEVNYTLIIPQEMQMDSLSYPPDFSNTKAGKTIYYYHKEMFMPDREFEIYFSR